MGNFKLKAAEYKSRLLELADFLESLDEKKFNMSSWCDPDHTCKTTACISGWAGILFSPVVKDYLEKTYKRQRMWEGLDNLKCKLSNYPESSEDYKNCNKALAEKRLEYYKFVDDTCFTEPDWLKVGRQILGLTEATANILFLPQDSFWQPVTRGHYNLRSITNKHAALVVRYLAYRPGRKFEHPYATYDEQAMQYYIEMRQAKERSKANVG